MPPPTNLLVYRLGSLGDTVMALPCFHLIRKVYPHARITLLTNQPVMGKAAPAMDILENSGLCDEAISYPVGTRSARELGQVRQTIRQIKPEALIHLAAGRGLLKSARDYVFFRSCGIKKIIGTPFRRKDLRVRPMNDGQFEPESERLVSRLSSLGSINLADQLSWDLGLKPEERNQALKILPPGGKDFLAVSVGTKVATKDWGEENWRKLLGLLSAEMPDATLVLLGAAEEHERSEKLGQAWTGGHVNLCGKIPPRVSAAVLERCRLFIGHDSGPMHLASAAGVATVGLFSWFNPPGQWFPGHRSWKFIKVHYPPLPPGGWNVDLQMKQGPSEGIRLLNCGDIFQSAMQLWRGNPKSIVSRASGVAKQTLA